MENKKLKGIILDCINFDEKVKSFLHDYLNKSSFIKFENSDCDIDDGDFKFIKNINDKFNLYTYENNYLVISSCISYLLESERITKIYYFKSEPTEIEFLNIEFLIKKFMPLANNKYYFEYSCNLGDYNNILRCIECKQEIHVLDIEGNTFYEKLKNISNKYCDEFNIKCCDDEGYSFKKI